MQIVSDSDRALLDAYGKITLFAYIDDVPMAAPIGAASYQGEWGSTESFSFGNACAASMTLSVAASLRELKGKRVRVTWAVSDVEYPLFSGRVERAPISAGRTIIEAWDEMYYGGSAPFAPTAALCGSCDAADAFRAVAGAVGAEADPEALEALQGLVIAAGLGNLPKETTNSAVAGYIAGLIGGSAVIGRDGKLTVKRCGPTQWLTQPYSGSAAAEGSDFTVSGITLQREETVTVTHAGGSSEQEQRIQVFQAGDGSLMVDNPLADQAAADRAFASLGGIAFRPGSYGFPGGLILEPGDLFTVESMDGDYSVLAASISFELDGGVKTEVACGGAPEDGGVPGQINQALKALEADYAKLRTLVAENAEILSARISNLRAEDIVAGRIRSTDFASVILSEVYPTPATFPASNLYPNNGEEIIRGIEIDFASGVIRGVFYSREMEDLKAAVADLSQRLDVLERASG